MFLYTVLAALSAIVAGILIAACTKKSKDVSYGKLDKIGRVTNIFLLVLYTCMSPFYMFIGMISTANHEGFLGVVGWAISILCASAALFCGLGLGFSVSLRKKGKSKLSFAVQFLGVIGIALTFLLYIFCVGNLIAPLN